MEAFGVDASFSYKYNQQRSVCDKDGLAMCPGFATTHVIPVCFMLVALDKDLIREENKFYASY